MRPALAPRGGMHGGGVGDQRVQRMNLHVNLILDSERRSGSSVSLKFMVRAAAAVIPIVLGIMLAGLVMVSRSASQSLKFAEQEKRQQAPMYQSAVVLQQQVKEYRQVADALAGWSASRADWRALLDRFQTVVPPSIQVLRLTVTETLGQAGNAPARIAGLNINGRVVGDRAEEAVQTLDRALRSDPVFTNVFAKVDVKRFEASANPAEKNTRVFEIECILAPRKTGKLP